MTQKRIPFNLEKAKAGAKLITRDGREVTEFHHFETVFGSRNSCVAVINGICHGFNTAGARTSGGDDICDLFMKSVLTERWYNVYKNMELGDSIGYRSKEDADRSSGSERIYYLKTYWDEEGIVQPQFTEWIPVDNLKQDQ